MRRRLFLATALLVTRPLLASDRGAAALWQRLKGGGLVVLMRHAATVPGIGDPPGFQLARCSTQRNLSDAGRASAREIGATFRRHGVPVERVLASRWCRCLDTAQLAFGRAEPAPMIDSMFRDDDDASRRKLAALRAYLRAFTGPGNLILVTHDVNIRALAGEIVAQGEMVVASIVADGSLQVLGTIAPPVLNQAP
ncbi:histidine phosphatase family protein [Massilia sp. PAMC28688]|uniref:histidine phosphatase family protein n=1 Tax=Massilia sp. PAMC28688 TaxID=2861283 RepID=UPI001C634CD9|nr:histidine phosphatase family protein [Massilia sp. PAMC28688]QYF94472.1 histidine phosphatase family protein [Massilia sp. PAMC28688]